MNFGIGSQVHQYKYRAIAVTNSVTCMPMASSLLFAQDDTSSFKIPTAPVQPASLTVDWNYPSGDSHLGLWFGRQLSQTQDSSPRKAMANNFLTQSEFSVGSEYTFTTQFAADGRQPHDPYMGGTLWPNVYTTQPIQPSQLVSWDQFYIPNFPGDLTLNTSTPVLNNDYAQRSLVSSSLGTFDGVASAGVQLSPAPSDNTLSPLFTTMSHMSSPTTPSSTYNRSFSSPASSKDLLLTSADKIQSDAQEPKSDKNQYTHREQLVLFREALKLPMDGAGPFIPQQMYKPHTTSDRKRYVEEVLLEAPLFFYSDDPVRCGILLKDALHSRTRKLHSRDKAVFEGRGPSVSIRLEWPGYRQWSKQIPTKDFRNPPGPITLAKLAKNVAKCVQRFIQERKSTAMEDESDHRWRIGDSSNDIKLEDLVLVSMHHVSLGSWQPQLRLVRPREPRISRPTITVTPPNTQVVSASSIPLSQHARTSQ